ncbi:MAG: leucine-rich repeat protein, partial [Prevotella micans]|nr:leucine-rich repeat protein [Prevotella micans]
FSLLFLAAFLLAPVRTMAQVTIGNYTYTFSGTEATVEKISPLSANVIIPSTVTYGSTTYNVTTLVNFPTETDNNTITSVSAPSIKKIISDIYVRNTRLLYKQQNLSSVSFPMLETIDGINVFQELPKLTTLSLPSLTTIDENASKCISDLSALTSLSLPRLSIIKGVYSIRGLSQFTSLSFPELTLVAGHNILEDCESLTSINLPKLKKIDNGAHWFLRYTKLSDITFADGCEINGGWGFLAWISSENVTVKGLTKIKGQMYILAHSATVKHASFPDLVEFNGGGIGQYHTELESFDAPKLEKITNYTSFLDNFLDGNISHLTSVNLPSLKEISNSTLFSAAPLLTLKLRSDLQVDANSRINLKTYPTVVTITDEGTVNDIPASVFANVKGGRFVVPKGKAALYATKWNLNTSKTMVYAPVDLKKTTAGTLYASGSITKADDSFTYGGTVYNNQYDFSHAMTEAECKNPSVLGDNDLGFTPTLSSLTVQNNTNALAGYSFYYASAYADSPTQAQQGDLTLTTLPLDNASALQGFGTTAAQLHKGVNRATGGFLFNGNGANVSEVYLPYTPDAISLTTNFLKAGEGVTVKSRSGSNYDFYWHPGNAAYVKGFYECKNTLIPEYRAWLSFPKTLSSNAKQFRLIFEDGETTGIESIVLPSDNARTADPEAWYTLLGTRLPAKPATAGVYIHGGRKVVVK